MARYAALIGILLLAVAAACSDPGAPEVSDDPEAPSGEPPERLPRTALDVLYISRSPRLLPPTSVDDPPGTGWPAEGQLVTWKAHVLNREEPVDSLPYRWRVDGEVVAEGRAAFPEGETVIPLERPWSFRRSLLAFALDPDSVARDSNATHDSLAVFTDALSVALWVDSSTYRSGQFEIWARREVQAWNEILARFSSDAIPGGIADRLRLDKVGVLPAGSGWPTSFDERDTDFQWYFSPSIRDARFRPYQDQTIVFHELGHQRGLIDIYAYEILHDTPNGSWVGILEPDGTLAVEGDRLFPDRREGARAVWEPTFDDVLMGGRYDHDTEITELTAYGLNLHAGVRTPWFRDQFGNYLNGFTQLERNQNDYATHLPERVELALVDEGGSPLASAELDVFLDHGRGGYHDLYLPEPDLVLTPDEYGVATLPRDFDADIPSGSTSKASAIILRARVGGAWDYAILPVYRLNLAFIRGERDVTRMEVAFDPR